MAQIRTRTRTIVSSLMRRQALERETVVIEEAVRSQAVLENLSATFDQLAQQLETQEVRAICNRIAGGQPLPNDLDAARRFARSFERCQSVALLAINKLKV